MVDDVREGDDNPKKRFFRSDDRVFRQGDGWYYSLREGDRGPFQTEKSARADLQRFINEQNDLNRLKSGKTDTRGDIKSPLSIDLGNDGKKTGQSGGRDVWKGLPDVD
jgi:Domain of unknown function (DUF6316)